MLTPVLLTKTLLALPTFNYVTPSVQLLTNDYFPIQLTLPFASVIKTVLFTLLGVIAEILKLFEGNVKSFH